MNSKIVTRLRLSSHSDLAKIALVDEAQQLSYQALWENVDRCSDLLKEQNIGPGKIVVLSFPNGIDLSISLLALMQVGAIPLIVNDTQEHSIDFEAINIYGFLVHNKSTHSIFYKQATEDGNKISANILFFNNARYQYKPLKQAALLLTSSGSTGNSKIVQLTEEGIIKNIESNVSSLGIRPSDTTIVALPMNYSYGLIGQFLSHLSCGCTVVLTDTKFAITQVPALISKHKASSVFMVPPMIRQINYWHSKGFYREDFSSLRFVTVGGNHIERCSLLKAMKLFKCQFVKTYGLAEAGPRVSTNIIRSVTSDTIGTVGKPIPNVTISIVDDHGKIVKAGQQGKVLVKSPSVTIGYLNAKTPNGTIPHQSILTKDIGYLSASGNLSVLGRAGDSIEINGKTVWFNQIADVIYSTGQVLKLTITKKENKLGVEVIPMGRNKITEEAVSLILCENFAVDAWSSFDISIAGTSTVGIVK